MSLYSPSVHSRSPKDVPESTAYSFGRQEQERDLKFTPERRSLPSITNTMSNPASLPPKASDGVFFVSQTLDIDAPIDKVWSVLLDFPSYRQWCVKYIKLSHSELTIHLKTRNSFV